MKQFAITLLLSVNTLLCLAQAPDTRRKIEVIGSAETEVTPDIIYINISLKEYMIGNSKKKTDIKDLERQLQSAVLNAGIPKENFMINNISSYNWNWSSKKATDFLARKQYKIKVTDLSKVNQLLDAVDSKAIEYSGIENYDYSKIEDLKKDLKIKALQNAKTKANYLVESIGEKLSNSIEIQEINEEVYAAPKYNMLRASAMASSDEGEGMPDIDFKKIKLKYQMRAIFEVR